MLWIVFLGLFTLAIVLAQAKHTSAARPRGRFARQVAWPVIPALPALRVRQRALGLARSVGIL